MSLGNKAYLSQLLRVSSEILKAEGENSWSKILSNASISSCITHYDNWNWGQDYYSIYIEIPLDLYIQNQETIKELEKRAGLIFEEMNRMQDSEHIAEILIMPDKKMSINRDKIADSFSKEELLVEIEYMKNTMVSVATWWPRIQSVEGEYNRRYKGLSEALKTLQIHNPNTYKDLRQRYWKWKTDFPTYQERRNYIKDLYAELIEILDESSEVSNIAVEVEWRKKVQRTVNEIRKRLNEAENEEQFQAIWVLCRDVLISLAQEVYDSNLHVTSDWVIPSKKDAFRMLEAYVWASLWGRKNERMRAYVKSALNLANELTHKRSWTKKDITLCSLAVIHVIKTIQILYED